MRILLVEDDESIACGLQDALQRRAYPVEWVSDGQQALAAAQFNPFDLIILDLGLPSLDGLDVLTALRQANINTPTLIVSARDSTQHRIAGLNCGADDYLVKPFDVDELFARIHAIERRTQGAARNVLELGPLSFDLQSQTVHYQNQMVALQRRELTLLKKFMENPRQVLTREQLEEALYGWSVDVGSNSIDVHVHNLRKKIDANLIKTVRGLGYRLNPKLLS